MTDNDLIKNLEKISLSRPNRVLKLQGYLLKDSNKEFLEIIIYKGFSSSTTHPVEIDSEKSVINFDHFFTKFMLYKAPLTNESDESLIEKKSSIFFLDQNNWI